MERFFNTAGPNIPEDNYTIDPLSRIDIEDVLTLIRQKRYFVLHAPRQTGKTSCMLALRDYLNEKGDYFAVYANVEGGQASRNDTQSVVKSTVDTLAEQFRGIVKSDLPYRPACGFPSECDSLRCARCEGLPYCALQSGHSYWRFGIPPQMISNMLKIWD